MPFANGRHPPSGGQSVDGKREGGYLSLARSYLAVGCPLQKVQRTTLSHVYRSHSRTVAPLPLFTLLDLGVSAPSCCEPSVLPHPSLASVTPVDTFENNPLLQQIPFVCGFLRGRILSVLVCPQIVPSYPSCSSVMSAAFPFYSQKILVWLVSYCWHRTAARSSGGEGSGRTRRW